jgi:hypothetical protein
MFQKDEIITALEDRVKFSKDAKTQTYYCKKGDKLKIILVSPPAIVVEHTKTKERFTIRQELVSPDVQ